MKKVLLILGLSAVCCSFGAYAQTRPVSESDSKVVKAIYYGIKAAAGGSNPCKGVALLKCGEVETTLTPISQHETLVQQTVKNAEGKVLSESAYVDRKTPAEVKKAISLETLEQGGKLKEASEND